MPYINFVSKKSHLNGTIFFKGDIKEAKKAIKEVFAKRREDDSFDVFIGNLIEGKPNIFGYASNIFNIELEINNSSENKSSIYSDAFRYAFEEPPVIQHVADQIADQTWRPTGRPTDRPALREPAAILGNVVVGGGGGAAVEQAAVAVPGQYVIINRGGGGGAGEPRESREQVSRPQVLPSINSSGSPTGIFVPEAENEELQRVNLAPIVDADMNEYAAAAEGEEADAQEQEALSAAVRGTTLPRRGVNGNIINEEPRRSVFYIDAGNVQGNQVSGFVNAIARNLDQQVDDHFFPAVNVPASIQQAQETLARYPVPPVAPPRRRRGRPSRAEISQRAADLEQAQEILHPLDVPGNVNDVGE